MDSDCNTISAYYMFGDEFHGDGEPSVLSTSLVDLPEGTFPDVLQDDVVIHAPEMRGRVTHARATHR